MHSSDLRIIVKNNFGGKRGDRGGLAGESPCTAAAPSWGNLTRAASTSQRARESKLNSTEAVADNAVAREGVVALVNNSLGRVERGGFVQICISRGQ